jgi:hypothetical protein
MTLGELFGGAIGIIAGLIFVASFFVISQTHNRSALIGWNVARVGSLVVLFVWFVAWWAPRI